MQHRFTVPVPVDVAWTALLDPHKVAPCMPGATLKRAEGKDFDGSVKVKLGPVSLTYKGSGTFTEVDENAHRVVIDASGKDARGNGTAAATVTAVLSEEDGSTAVGVDTDLKVTGKPAQMGRGMISDVAGKILDQFADCLSGQLAGGSTGESTTAAAPSSSAETSADSATSSAGKPSIPDDETVEASTSAPSREAREADSAGAAMSSAPQEPADAVSAPAERAEEINLVGAAGPAMAKRAVPFLATLAACVVLIVLLRRRKTKQSSAADM